MIAIAISFVLLLILSGCYSVVAGGRPARIAYLLMVIATVATQVVTLDTDARLPLLLVDTALLAGLIGIGLFSSSYWPLWAAGLHASGVAASIAVLLSHQIDFNLYHAILGFWSIPIFVMIPVGIYLDRRGMCHAEPPR